MLSIIIPTYNEEKYLPILLNSIRNQVISDPYEIIVADNNSTDRTVAIAREFGAIVTSGGLPGEGRNCGARIAEGEVLLFLDADVELTSPWFLVDCLDEFEEKKFGCATCCVTPLSPDKLYIFGHEAYNFFINAFVNISPFAPGFCLWAKSDIHRAINGFDQEIKLAEDSDYVKRANKISSFGILKEHKIPVSVRRFERDGKLKVISKYVLCGLYMVFVGKVKTDIFHYTWGHEDEEKKG